MNVPSATYRIQFSSAFTLKDLKEKIPYLDALGISTIYASPFFEAREGSTHGYDIINPLKINPEIGTLEELREIHKKLKDKGMSWLQDIVPNHMAYDSRNQWLRNVLELGPTSRYYNFFDVNWNYSKQTLQGKVMAPFLGDELEKVIRKSQIALVYDRTGFAFHYYQQVYPASWHSYHFILSQSLKVLKKQHTKSSSAYKQVKELQDAIDELHPDETQWDQLKNRLYEFVQQEKAVAEAINQTLSKINNSPKRLTEVLEQQYFKLVHWKMTEKEINYRRFFTINDLICIRMEDEGVFNYYHQFIKQLCEEDLISGFRIDHIDGLFDPGAYLERLREIIGKDRYLVIEKILEWEERLPINWPIQGTSGYVFLAIVSNLFTSSKQEEKFSSAYQGLIPRLAEYEDLIFDKKIFMLQERMRGELIYLFQLLDRLHLMPVKGKDGADKMFEALTGFLAAFPVYRIYPFQFPLTYRQREVIMQAYETALKKLPKHKESLDHLLGIFMGEGAGDEEHMLFFLKRCQQYTGPLTAKGVEDTLFYLYNKLISHNEVGDSPHVFGISNMEFHDIMRRRSLHFPFSINATATHDTKRGEDARMRLNVLSEIPQPWFANVAAWKEANSLVRKNKKVPDDNEEYFIYQAIIGAWPPDDVIDDDFVRRTQDYLLKVLREGKLHSDWSEPDEDYEQTVLDFIAAILNNQSFRRSFDPFCRKIIFFGALYSLGQCLIKVTAPGVPDIYQGTELWDLSYVDPDNRRPVDYERRSAYLKEMKENAGAPYITEILDHYEDGRIKLFTLFHALEERRLHQQVFNEGKYLPLEVAGSRSENIICYARKTGNNWYIIIVPKLLAERSAAGQYPVGQTMWVDAEVTLPEGAPAVWRNIFTGAELSAKNNISLHEALAVFPVALLKATTNEI